MLTFSKTVFSKINIYIRPSGKESENSYRKLKSSQWTGTRTHTWKQNWNILTDTTVLLNQKRAKYERDMERESMGGKKIEKERGYSYQKIEEISG